MINCALPEDSLSKLICFKCGKPLSYFPIYNTEAGPLCGRCGLPQDGAIRNEIFEEIAKYVEFQCCNKQNGCLEILLPKDVENHELHCKFQTFACPFKCPAKWKGYAVDFLRHKENDHPTSLLNVCCFQVDFIKAHNKIKFMSYLDVLYLINCRYSRNKKIFSCTVTHIGFEPVDDNLNYQIIFEDRGNQFKHTVCSDLNATVRIDKSGLNVLLKNPATILASVKILQKRPVTGSVRKKSKIANAELLKHFECVVCLNYMLSSIYLCTNGHSICESCKNKVETCPTCRSEIRTARNYALEGLVSDFKFPCKFGKCPYIDKGSVIKKHWETCNFTENDCPLKKLYGCEKKFVCSELSNHIYKEHNKHWYKYNVISHSITIDLSCSYEEVFILKYCSDVFQVNFSYRIGHFTFAVKLLNNLVNSFKYRFVVEILDTKDNKNRFCCSKNLIPLEQDCMKIDIDLIRHLIDREFKFRLFVLKN